MKCGKIGGKVAVVRERPTNWCKIATNGVESWREGSNGSLDILV